MRLADLSPRWFSYGDNPRAGFVFLCPHCGKTWLSCKSVAIPMREQLKGFAAMGLVATGPGSDVVPTKPDFAWTITGDFENLTATPSVDASPARCWHGHITGGQIVGGI